jgi:DNA-binding CsgD family transcriptional regulator/PAS domain-containing protein
MRLWLRDRPGVPLLIAGHVRVDVPEDHPGPRRQGATSRHGLVATAAPTEDAPGIELKIWREKAPGPFRREAGELLLWLAPRLQRAAAIAYDMRRVSIERTTLLTALDHLTLGVVSVDADLSVRTSNRVAQRYLEQNDGLRIVHGRLAATHYDDQQRLAAVVQSTMTQCGGAVGAVPLRRANGRRPLTLIIEAVSPQPGAPDDFARALILFGDPEERAEAGLESLGSLFGLTRAESRVAARLAMGLPLTEVARELGISHQTARSYLKTAFRKTNTCRQGELIGLLLGGPSNLPV